MKPYSLSLRVDGRDNAPWLIAIAIVGLVGAVALRVVGLPGTDLHGPLHQAGIMDPFCGGTRATYVLVRGDLIGSWSWNPLVPLLALGTVAVVARSSTGWLSHRWINVHLPRRVLLIVGAVALVALEVNQQLQADRLMNDLPT